MPKQCLIAVFHERSGWTLAGSYIDKIREAGREPLEGGAGGDGGGAGGVEFEVVERRGEAAVRLEEADWLIGLPVTGDVVRTRGERLEWVQLTGSLGDVTPAVSAAMARGARVSSAAGARAPQLAEHAVTLALTMLRGVDEAVRMQAEHRWGGKRLARSMRTMAGARVGLLAHEAVGREAAARLGVFGARVVAPGWEAAEGVRVWGGGSDGATEGRSDEVKSEAGAAGVTGEVERVGELREFLSVCDVVIVALPRTPTTVGLIARRELAAMRESAVLVDVGRAGVVRQGELLEALRRKRLGGAALDVFETEPLPTTSPWWTMPNVVLTPRVASASPRYWSQATELICENVRRMRRGERPMDLISPAGIDETWGGGRGRRGGLGAGAEATGVR